MNLLCTVSHSGVERNEKSNKLAKSSPFDYDITPQLYQRFLLIAFSRDIRHEWTGCMPSRRLVRGTNKAIGSTLKKSKIRH